VSVNALADANARFVDYVNGVNARADVATRVRTAVDRRAIAARNLVLVTKPADLEIEKADVTAAHHDVQTHLATLNKMLADAPDTTDQARALVGELNRIEAAYGPVALAIVDLALNKKQAEAISKMNEECRPLLAALVKAAQAYDAFTDVRSAELLKIAEASYDHQRVMLVTAGCIALLVAIALGILITRSLARALGAEPAALGGVAQRIAGGDLSPVPDAAGAPGGSVLASLSAMQQSLATIVSQVRGASDSIATGSTQISSGNSDLNHRTEEQATALQQTASTMEELGTTVHNNSDNAKQANELALSASAVASRGGAVVSEVVDTMKGINDSSRRIADIISVIDGIAFQTNILALNAAVEAARAGEQGRGFAVVASEVRNLAQRSGEAAKEIRGLISTSVERVEQGTVLVDQAGATMTEIVASIKRVSDIVGEISSASVEQSMGVTQISQAVSQMDTATQQNAALVEQSAAAAESLQRQAAQLVAAVAIFKLGEDTGLSTAKAAAPAAAAKPRPAASPAAKVERRGPGRATNVTRPPFGNAKPAAPRASDPVVVAPAHTGTDGGWDSF
jgi:methyl-accepting chemotaxis protein-1 (serine sensor receptor)